MLSDGEKRPMTIKRTLRLAPPSVENLTPTELEWNDTEDAMAPPPPAEGRPARRRKLERAVAEVLADAPAELEELEELADFVALVLVKLLARLRVK